MRGVLWSGSILMACICPPREAAAQSVPVYVNPRVPIGHLRLMTGHAQTSLPGRPGRPTYVAPDMTFVYGVPETVPAAPSGRTHIYVVIPDVRVRPSDVLIDPPEVRFAPSDPSSRSGERSDEVIPDGT